MGCYRCGQPEEPLGAHLNRVLELVYRQGWAVQGVVGDRWHPPYAYTVGLTGLGLPELVVTGRSPESAACLLNSVAYRASRGEQLRAGRVVPVDPEQPATDPGHVTVPLADAEVHVPVAVRLYGEGVRAVQVVWPDEQGLHPWDARYDGAEQWLVGAVVG